MKTNAKVQEVKGSNAYCRDCYADQLGSKQALKLSAIPKGARALKLMVGYGSGGSVYLCLLHAECLAADIMRQLP